MTIDRIPPENLSIEFRPGKAQPWVVLSGGSVVIARRISRAAAIASATSRLLVRDERWKRLYDQYNADRAAIYNEIASEIDKLAPQEPGKEAP